MTGSFEMAKIFPVLVISDGSRGELMCRTFYLQNYDLCELWFMQNSASPECQGPIKAFLSADTFQ